MKKKMIALLAGALMTISASSAFAYFGDGELKFFSYGNLAASTEVGVDLGWISSLLTTGADTTISAGASAFNTLFSCAIPIPLFTPASTAHDAATGKRLGCRTPG